MLFLSCRNIQCWNLDIWVHMLLIHVTISVNSCWLTKTDDLWSLFQCSHHYQNYQKVIYSSSSFQAYSNYSICIVFKVIIQNDNLGTCYEIALRWMSHNLINEKSTLVSVTSANVDADLCHHLAWLAVMSQTQLIELLAVTPFTTCWIRKETLLTADSH